MRKDAIFVDNNEEVALDSEAPIEQTKQEKKDHRIGQTRGTIATIVMLLPYLLSFFVFIVLPVFLAIILSFTNFNSMTFP